MIISTINSINNSNVSLFYSAKLSYTTEVNKKKSLNKSFLLDFGYVESVGSVLQL